MLRPKYVLFGIIGLMAAYVLQHNERFLLNATDPVWEHYEPFKWWLLLHGLAGACALLLAPMQFSDRLRQRHAKFHRVVGRIYIAGSLIAAPVGTYIQFFQEGMGAPRSLSVATAVFATVWMLTTAIALVFIRRRKVQQHRQWMTRSFAVALVFLEVRVVLGVTGWEQLGPAAIETVVWSCLVFSMLAADIILQLQESLRSRAIAARG